jgi:hypothetical protein
MVGAIGFKPTETLETKRLRESGDTYGALWDSSEQLLDMNFDIDLRSEPVSSQNGAKREPIGVCLNRINAALGATVRIKLPDWHQRRCPRLSVHAQGASSTFQ